MDEAQIDFSGFPAGGVAVVIGASGGVGGALVTALQRVPEFSEVVGFSRSGALPVDITSEASIATAVQSLSGREIRLVIDATGFLHGDGFMPEKSFKELNAAHLAASFAANALGPALLMKHFLPLFPRQGRAVFASLSAKVGSIGDNQIGGWYSYRAAKAALNQLVHTAAIELKRNRPEAVCVVLHPGTVTSRLSAPFAKSGLHVRPPAEAAADLLGVINRLAPTASGGFFDYKGASLPW
ncbi:MAG: C-factor [Acidocella sp. 20-57-95]|nr:MAG: C-factor [Acidocella sp. 20-57-95]HQT63875.1 SDR family oxidoreductase [Acidocella sp.]HQU03079.1 SDR family oxidoreductase [Acidocella sp.]